MIDIQEKNYSQLLSFIQRQDWPFEEKEELTAKRINIKHGKYSCVTKVYRNGTIQVQGGDSDLKTCLIQAKDAIENEAPIGEVLPFEIERFPDLLVERISEIDLVIVRFVKEAILSFKAGSLVACAFLLGAASEKAVLILVDTYANAISDEKSKEKFKERISNRFISRKYDEFKRSLKSSRNKLEDSWTQDIEIKIEAIFNFCRICRNEAGHPHLPPNLDKGVILANMGQFVKYIEDLYQLNRWFSQNKVEL